MRNIILIFAILVAILIILELILKLFFGLGNPPLYIADENIGYLLAPHQDVKRFGNRIIINQYSLRTHPLTEEKTLSHLRILCLGDSIINGGWWTDQDATIPALIEKKISSINNIEVLNASANSWGPRNQLAYLRKFGLFQAKIVVLVLNTDDLFATAPTSIPVGRAFNYPDKKPLLALAELFDYLKKSKSAIPEMAAIHQEKGDRVGKNLTAIAEIKAIVIENKSQFLLAMTPLLREVKPPGSRDYEVKARERLREFTQNEQIPYLDFLPIFTEESESESLYRDHIHLSPKGNQIVSQKIADQLKLKQ